MKLRYLYRKILTILKIKKVCTACYGKKFCSVYKGPTVMRPDSLGDKYILVEKGGIRYKECSRCNGTGFIYY